MTVALNPYISLRNNAREAMEFYRSVFGGDLLINTFKELNAAQTPDEEDLVMHSQLTAPNGLVLMASDTPQRMQYQPGTNVSLSLSGDDEATLTGYFEKLSAGGNVTMPLSKAIWGDSFGMLVDRFGFNWLVNITAPKA